MAGSTETLTELARSVSALGTFRSTTAAVKPIQCTSVVSARCSWRRSFQSSMQMQHPDQRRPPRQPHQMLHSMNVASSPSSSASLTPAATATSPMTTLPPEPTTCRAIAAPMPARRDRKVATHAGGWRCSQGAVLNVCFHAGSQQLTVASGCNCTADASACSEMLLN